MRKLISLLTALLSGLVSPARAQAAGPAPQAAENLPAPRKIGLAEFDRLRTERKFTVLDVRTPGEFAAGHVPGATNLNFNSPDFAKTISSLDKEKPYLVHCAAGGRSARAVALMQRTGFKNLFDFSGGWGEWKKAGKPAEK